jgi:hypothetical protein
MNQPAEANPYGRMILKDVERRKRRTKKRKTSKVRSNKSRIYRTVIQQEEKFDKEKMLTSTGIGNILRFIKSIMSIKMDWSTQ